MCIESFQIHMVSHMVPKTLKVIRKTLTMNNMTEQLEAIKEGHSCIFLNKMNLQDGHSSAFFSIEKKLQPIFHAGLRNLIFNGSSL